jgi:hypothetical protein
MHHEQEVQMIAYQIWEEKGREHGHDMEHWLKAEAIWQEKHDRETLTVQPAAVPQKSAIGFQSKSATAHHKPSAK